MLVTAALAWRAPSASRPGTAEPSPKRLPWCYILSQSVVCSIVDDIILYHIRVYHRSYYIILYHSMLYYSVL